MHPVIRHVTERIRHRSEQSRQQYIELMQLQAAQGRPRASNWPAVIWRTWLPPPAGTEIDIDGYDTL